jgi:hypothetical protein
MMTTTEAKIETLMATARSIQREQHQLITAARNPTRFGQLERQLEGPGGIWAQIDTLRTADGTCEHGYRHGCRACDPDGQ